MLCLTAVSIPTKRKVQDLIRNKLFFQSEYTLRLWELHTHWLSLITSLIQSSNSFQDIQKYRLLLLALLQQPRTKNCWRDRDGKGTRDWQKRGVMVEFSNFEHRRLNSVTQWQIQCNTDCCRKAFLPTVTYNLQQWLWGVLENQKNPWFLRMIQYFWLKWIKFKSKHKTFLPFNCCSECNIQLYADDTIIYCSKQRITDINVSLQHDLESIQLWLSSNKLILNKTQS